ncbi:hypothetical protein B0T17DRAFT_94529 [Bombardia bombarda]|uniref:Rhodopsin n=1 Tax=Bombardia bombarda TaxID=252184 RepID=A0AA39XMU3_9PEZI|nr:hypothetical protein B0T17DRAFT_94529 [Bombardia bombarda]
MSHQKYDEPPAYGGNPQAPQAAYGGQQQQYYNGASPPPQDGGYYQSGPQMGYQQQPQGGYPPQQGYPPQGYPQQGGGYPPQQGPPGAYYNPQQQQGYPPQQGRLFRGMSRRYGVLLLLGHFVLSGQTQSKTKQKHLDTFILLITKKDGTNKLRRDWCCGRATTAMVAKTGKSTGMATTQLAGWLNRPARSTDHLPKPNYLSKPNYVCAATSWRRNGDLRLR